MNNSKLGIEIMLLKAIIFLWWENITFINTLKWFDQNSYEIWHIRDGNSVGEGKKDTHTPSKVWFPSDASRV